MNTRGVHLLCELSGCNKAALADINAVRASLEMAAKAANATVLNSSFHQFSLTGISGVLCLAESHISIHTWPECGYAAVDIYTCGDTATPHQGISVLASALKAQGTIVREVTRGIESGNDVFTNRDASALLKDPDARLRR